MSTATAEFENNSIYIVLKLRSGGPPDFHWAIFVPTAKPQGILWHATNITGGWAVETKTNYNLPLSMAFCVALRVGSITGAVDDFDTLKATMEGVPGTGVSSFHTQEVFDCRVWVKDALVALQDAGIINLTVDTSTIEQDAFDKAYQNRERVEQAPNQAKIVNTTGYSTTS